MFVGRGMSMAASFSVTIIEMSHYQDPQGERNYDGFPTLELAREFARRWVRDSVEELRSPGQSPEEFRKLWFIYGEDAFTEGYRGPDELSYFVEHPATAEECDWAAALKEAGLR